MQNLFVNRRIIFLSLLIYLLLISPVNAAQIENIENQEKVYNLTLINGDVWQGINGGVVVKNSSQPYEEQFYHKLNSGFKANVAYCIAGDENGGIWMGTDNGVLYLDKKGVWTHFNKINSPIMSDTILEISFDNQGGIWFGTWGKGAYYLDKTKKWYSYNTQNSKMPSNNIYTITPDVKGGVWFGTDSCGAAYRDRDGNWKIYDIRNSDIPGNDVLDIALDTKGEIWFATYQGLGYLTSQGEWKIFNINNGFPSNMVYCLDASPEGLWVGTDVGLVHLTSDHQFKTYPIPTEGSPLIKQVTLDQEGQIWTALWDHGVLVFNPKENVWKKHGGEIRLFYGDKHLKSNVPVMVENGRTLVPGRVILENLGAKLTWDGKTKKVQVLLEDEKFEFFVNKNSANINGELRNLDVPARVIKGSTMLPLRFIAENLGLSVNWDGTLKTIRLNKKMKI